jgi:hypothetical protein
MAPINHFDPWGILQIFRKISQAAEFSGIFRRHGLPMLPSWGVASILPANSVLKFRLQCVGMKMGQSFALERSARAETKNRQVQDI